MVAGAGMGMAPGARFIAARVFNDSGVSTDSAVHLAFQWLLDPDGNPATDDAPDVVNASWDALLPTCDREFEPDLQALRAAHILPVFAAGNDGPGASSDTSPANLPEAFAVGAADSATTIAAFSSIGPSRCDGGSSHRSSRREPASARPTASASMRPASRERRSRRRTWPARWRSCSRSHPS